MRSLFCATFLILFGATTLGSAGSQNPAAAKESAPTAPSLIELAIVASPADGVDLDAETKKLLAWAEKNPAVDPHKFQEVAEKDGGPKAGFRWFPSRRHEARLDSGAESKKDIRWELVRIEKDPKFRFGAGDIASLKLDADSLRGPALVFTIVESRRADFQAFTEKNLKRSFAWIVKGQIWVAPTILTPITGIGMIDSCASTEETEYLVKEWKMMNEPAYIKVQHCLISFKGSLPKPTVTRSKEEAKKLAYDLLERVRKGEDFDKIIKEYTDDSPPGIYAMSNIGQPQKQGCYPRQKMVAAFGDTGFPLKVGEYGIADFDPTTSPFGWHIVKRIE